MSFNDPIDGTNAGGTGGSSGSTSGGGTTGGTGSGGLGGSTGAGTGSGGYGGSGGDVGTGGATEGTGSGLGGSTGGLGGSTGGSTGGLGGSTGGSTGGLGGSTGGSTGGLGGSTGGSTGGVGGSTGGSTGGLGGSTGGSTGGLGGSTGGTGADGFSGSSGVGGSLGGGTTGGYGGSTGGTGLGDGSPGLEGSAGAAGDDFELHEPEYRRHYTTVGTETAGAGTYEEARTGYVAGHVAASNPAYADRTYEEVEVDLERNVGTERFGRVREFARHSFEWKRVLAGVALVAGGYWASKKLFSAASELSEEEERDCRTYYETHPMRSAGVPYSQARTVYVLGYVASRNPDYAGRGYDDVETHLRSGYSGRGTGSYDALRDFGRRGYERGMGRGGGIGGTGGISGAGGISAAGGTGTAGGYGGTGTGPGSTGGIV